MPPAIVERASDDVKLASHPLRMRILTHLVTVIASPNEMAKMFGESLPLVSYHVRILREGSAVELVRTTPRRGAIEHHYALTDIGEHVLNRYGPKPKFEVLRGGTYVVHVCCTPGCTASESIDVSGANKTSIGIPEGWTRDRAEMHCPEHGA
jgi:DNA-binding transcriptional ArsR family regulator